MTPVQAALASKVKQLREGRGWSQEDLSHKAGIHPTYLSGLECGKRNPTVKVLEKIAKALDVYVTDLF
jgi:transcriptional regulator with XRE-family HTH domain